MYTLPGVWGVVVPMDMPLALISIVVVMGPLTKRPPFAGAVPTLGIVVVVPV